MSGLLSGGNLGKRYLFIGVAAAVVVMAAILPETPGLGYSGRMTVALMAAGVILWIAEAMPNAITALALMALMPFLSVCSFSEAWSNSISSTIFFLIGTYSFTVALSSTTLPLRFAGVIMRWAKNDSGKIILGFMCGAAIISMVMTDIAACSVFMALCLHILEANGAEKGKSRLGKALMIAVPWGSAIGGAATLCGCGLNIMVVGVLESNFGISVSFLTWLICAMPMAVAVLPLSWLLLVKCFKPEPISQEAYESTIEQCKGLPSITIREKWAVAIILVTLALWILSTWVTVLNTAAVVMVTMSFFFLPGINVMPFGDFVKGVNWGIVLMIMAVTSISSAMAVNGVGEWLIDVATAGSGAALNGFAVLLIAAVLGCILHNTIPVGPAVCGILVIPFAQMALASDVSLTALAVVLGWECGVTLIVPLDCVPMVSYSYGYYKFGDMIKLGWVPSLLMVVYAVTALPGICGLLGVV